MSSAAFNQAMRRRGWQLIAGSGSKTFVHQATGRRFVGEHWDNEVGMMAWHWLAARGLLPAVVGFDTEPASYFGEQHE